MQQQRRKVRVKRTPPQEPTTSDDIFRMEREIQKLRDMINQDAKVIQALHDTQQQLLADKASLTQNRNRLRETVRILRAAASNQRESGEIKN